MNIIDIICFLFVALPLWVVIWVVIGYETASIIRNTEFKKYRKKCDEFDNK